MKNRITALLLLMIFIFGLVGCDKCVSVEYESVEVTVIDEHYRSSYITPIYNGKTFVMVTYPASYHIIVEYNGSEYTVDDSETYYKYKDKIGQTTTGELEIRNYDDGSVKHYIVGLE